MFPKPAPTENSTPMTETTDPRRGLKIIIVSLLVLLAAAIVWRLFNRDDGASRRGERVPAAVEVAQIEVETIELRRSFSGSLEASAAFVLSPKVTGRIEEIAVDIGDTIRRGQVVARLWDAEYFQGVRQAEADLAVGQANLVQRESLLEVASRELERVKVLQGRGITSEAQFDNAQIEFLEASAALAIASAQMSRAESSLESAKIRLDYTVIRADWSDGDDERIVAERFVDAGQNVSANDELLYVIELTPITGVFFVTERDYSSLKVGQLVSLKTDAFPEDSFDGVVSRIAPVFQESSRQARVEISIQNTDRRLRPGMFIRAEAKLAVAEDAVVVPYDAISRRDETSGVFVLEDDALTVRWIPVELGIRAGDRVQLVDFPKRSGRVVTLGQQLIGDQAAVMIPGDNATE